MQTTLQPSLYKALQATATLLILRLSAPALCKLLIPAPGFGLAAGPAFAAAPSCSAVRGVEPTPIASPLPRLLACTSPISATTVVGAIPCCRVHSLQWALVLVTVCFRPKGSVRKRSVN